MDRAYVMSPEKLVTDNIMNAQSLDLTNEWVLELALQCAAVERPLREDEFALFVGREMKSFKGGLLYDAVHNVWCADAKWEGQPAWKNPIRCIGEEYWDAWDEVLGRVIERVEGTRIAWTLYEGK